MFDSTARPGMRSKLGSLEGCSLAGHSLKTSTLTGSSLSGDSLGAQIYQLQPMSGDDATTAARAKLEDYGRKAAATLTKHISTLPPDKRPAAMRDAMNELDPNLYDRAKVLATRAQQTGMSPQAALQQGISQAIVEGFMSQLQKLGQRGPGALQGLGLICGMVPLKNPGELGVWGLSWLASQISSGVHSAAGAVSSAASAVKGLTCSVLNSGGAQAAAQVAGSVPSAASVGVAAGAAIAGQLCSKPQAGMPAGPTYIQPQTNYLPYILGGVGLLAVVMIATRK